jgi:hypothetical protein
LPWRVDLLSNGFFAFNMVCSLLSPPMVSDQASMEYIHQWILALSAH